MLKLNYTESGLHLERVNVSLEELLTQRLILTLTGQSIYLEGVMHFALPSLQIV